MNKVIRFGVFTAIVAFFCSCVTSSKEVANEYFNHLSNPNDANKVEKIYVRMPSEVIHTNQTLNQIDNFSRLSEKVQDSVIMANTKILNKLSDEVFLSKFADNLIYHLKRFGVPIEIIFDESDLPKAVDNKVFVLDILQIEAEEFIKKSRSEYTDNSGIYYHYDYNLNGFSTNIWYKLNADTNVYFKNFEVMDSFEGKIDGIKNKTAIISGYFKRISVNDAYKTALLGGKQSAVLFIEKIINDYLASKGYTKCYYLYYPQQNELSSSSYYELKEGRSFMKVNSK